MLTIRRNIERPRASVLREFKGAPSGFVTDAINSRGCLDWHIKPLTPDMYLCGPAVTALCAPGDLVVGDRDGVVIVPLSQIDEAVAQLRLVKKKEAEAEAKVKRGEKLQFWNEADLKGRVRYLD